MPHYGIEASGSKRTYMTKIISKDYRVHEGHEIKLGKWPTRVKHTYNSKEDYAKILTRHKEELAEYQDLLYASKTHSLLIIFQAMDAAGKDGMIKHVMSGINPQGCQVFSFKAPSASELQHDFLWRTTRDLPERGRIGIFNRSYYEEVLITRVHPEILAGEGVPKSADLKELWRQRYRSIVNLEKHLHDNGTHILKFYLHISKDEQRKRFLARIDDRDKNWKFELSDMKERAFWKDYMKAYEKCLTETTSAHSPWYVVPADDKENARIIVSRVILDTFEGLKMKYPAVSDEVRQELAEIRKQLEGE
jgi:PPK2 family polyphosphate:nucleotide phosphotransferase